MLWYQECAEQDFVSSWTIFGVDLGFSDPFPHVCGPRCVQTSLCPLSHSRQELRTTPLGNPPALPHKLRKLYFLLILWLF